MGRYVPPELEGVATFNQASGKGHALGARASKLKSQGILVVRFECPFPIWCTNCQPEQIIGQGVRFNAEKKKVGNYYSTPIWSFVIKHTICGGTIEIRTDPKNTEYVVVSGGRRRDTGVEKILEGEIQIGLSTEENEKLLNEGGFGQLEKKNEDKHIANTQQARINELLKRSDRDWADPYTMNKKVRKDFRVGRRKRQADERSGLELQDKFGIGLDLVAPEENDATRAKYIEFANGTEASATHKPLFTQSSTHSLVQDKQNRDQPSQKHTFETKKARLTTTLQENTRTAVDPFADASQRWEPTSQRRNLRDATLTTRSDSINLALAGSGVLVDYESDSDS